MATPLEIVKGGVEIASGILNLKDDLASRRTIRDRDRVCEALRAIYFTPTGVLDLLQQLIDGRSPKVEEVQSILNHFNDVEWRVDRALEELAFDARFGNLSLSISTVNQLDQIRWGKINVRRAVQEAINHYGQPRRKVDEGGLVELRDAIVNLNFLIEQIEEKMNVRAR